jgi:NAD(P)-dependent dehydrogenase (short-subunit alcohol dehydrogenase family)
MHALRAALATAAGLAAVRAAIRRARPGYDLADRVALITGGSRGLGLEIARVMAAQGARVAICARHEEELERAREDLAARGAAVLALPCDVTEKDQVARAVTDTVTRFGRLDVLVNNAGVIQVGPPEAMTPDDYDRAMRVHFWGPFHMIQAALPHLRMVRQGRIVNISSFAGRISVPHLLPYSASKFALTGLSEGLRGALGAEGIKVTTVCPGLMRTGSTGRAWFKGRPRSEHAWFSVAGSAPLLAMDSRRAARRIVAACRRGDAEVRLPFWATLAIAGHAVFPGLGTRAMAAAEWFLPKQVDGEGMVEGRDVPSVASRSVLTALGRRAAWRNNESTGEA